MFSHVCKQLPCRLRDLTLKMQNGSSGEKSRSTWATPTQLDGSLMLSSDSKTQNGRSAASIDLSLTPSHWSQECDKAAHCPWFFSVLCWKGRRRKPKGYRKGKDTICLCLQTVILHKRSQKLSLKTCRNDSFSCVAGYRISLEQTNSFSRQRQQTQRERLWTYSRSQQPHRKEVTGVKSTKEVKDLYREKLKLLRGRIKHQEMERHPMLMDW